MYRELMRLLRYNCVKSHRASRLVSSLLTSYDQYSIYRTFQILYHKITKECPKYLNTKHTCSLCEYFARCMQWQWQYYDQPYYLHCTVHSLLHCTVHSLSSLWYITLICTNNNKEYFVLKSTKKQRLESLLRIVLQKPHTVLHL